MTFTWFSSMTHGFLPTALGFMHFGPVLCARVLPAGPWHALYGSLLCGLDIPAGAEKELLLDSGILHLMITSGVHLMFIERALFAFPTRVRNFVLTGYGFLLGFRLPILRALGRRFTRPWLSFRYGLTSLQCEAVVAVLALALNPSWAMNRSFQMSWMCALALGLPRLIRWVTLDLALKCYVLLFPFCFASPISLAWNVLLVPFVGFILLPSSLLALIVPAARPLSDLLWSLLLHLLRLGPRATPWNFFLSTTLLAGLPPLLHFTFLILEVRWRRARAFLYS